MGTVRRAWDRLFVLVLAGMAGGAACLLAAQVILILAGVT